MTDVEARGLFEEVINCNKYHTTLTLSCAVQADQDGNAGLDYSEFVRLWEIVRGEGQVSRWARML